MLIYGQNLKDLSTRAATLLSVLCGQQVREIITALDIWNITLEENYIVNRIGDDLKITSTIQKYMPSVLFDKVSRNHKTHGRQYYVINYNVKDDVAR